MKINVFYYPFGEVIEVRKKSELELYLSQQNLLFQQWYRIVFGRGYYEQNRKISL